MVLPVLTRAQEAGSAKPGWLVDWGPVHALFSHPDPPFWRWPQIHFSVRRDRSQRRMPAVHVGWRWTGLAVVFAPRRRKAAG